LRYFRISDVAIKVVNLFQNFTGMNSPYYPNERQFMPSRDALLMWLRTRKTDEKTKPTISGLFETVNYVSDAGWTMLAILVEFGALCLTLYAAYARFVQRQDAQVLAFSVLAVVLFIAFDIIGVFLHSSDRESKVLASRELRLSPDKHRKRDLLMVISKITNREFFGSIFLFLSAIIKVGALFLLGIAAHNQYVAIVILILYFIVVYVHIYHTGYWLSARRTSKMLKREEAEWSANEDREIAQPQRFIFHSSKPMEKSNFQLNRQEINFLNEKQEPDGSKSFEYELVTYGCFWDEDIVKLAGAFDTTSDFFRSLIDACMRLQLIQLGRLPN